MNISEGCKCAGERCYFFEISPKRFLSKFLSLTSPPLFLKFVSTCSFLFACRLLIRLYSPCLGKGSPTWAPRSVSSQSLRSDTRESSTPSTRRSRLLPLPKVHLLIQCCGSGILDLVLFDSGSGMDKNPDPDNLSERRKGF